MQFKKGTHIYSSDGQSIGSVDRVVMDPRAHEVSGLIVRHGVFADDKVIPLDLVTSATEDRVTLNKPGAELQDLPKFEETYYVPADNVAGTDETAVVHYAEPLYAYPPIGTPWWGFGAYAGYAPFGTDFEPEYAQRVARNIPEGEVAVKEGAHVMSLDEKHVGDVVEILTDSATNHPTHFVLSHGLIFKGQKLIPANWVQDVDDETVMLTVNTRIVDSLPEYTGSAVHT